MGYHRAGFDVVGVDIVRQHSYPFTFLQGNADTWPLDGFDAIHASPPCKAFTSAGNPDRQRLRLFEPHGDHLTPTLARLADLEIPWVVENVPGAPMPPGSVTYCGSSFGLDVRRHRLFASNVKLVAPPCDHAWQVERGRIFPSLNNAARKAKVGAYVVGVHGFIQGRGDTLELRSRAMGINWLDNEQLTQAIPPAFTEHIGSQLLAAMNEVGQ